MRRVIVQLFAIATLVSCAPGNDEPKLDVLLVGGNVYSGEDAASVTADVGIIGDRIVAVGDLSEREAGMRLDVTGLAVVPGFVDIHSHAVRDDPTDGIFRWPDAENLIRQGVTTVIGGPDGGSPLPLEDDFRRLEDNPAAVNFGSFVGQGSVRAKVVGYDDRPATGEEQDRPRHRHWGRSI